MFVVVSFASVNEKLCEDFENVHFLVSMHDTQNKERREERDERDTKSALFFLGLSECAYVLCICIYMCACVYTHSACTLYVNE